MIDKLSHVTDAAIRAIPPAWPLAATVAVNPFLGQVGEDLAQVGARVARVAGTSVTMPRAWYAAKLAKGEICEADLAGALSASRSSLKPSSTAELRALTRTNRNVATALPTIADLVANSSETDWPGIIRDSIGAWAAGFFDQGQALWAAPRTGSAYASWRAHATRDLTPEILGLGGFARFIVDAPRDADAAIARSVATLGLTELALPTALHRLLMTLEGWGQVGRYRLWMAELEGSTDETARDLIAIRLLWEEALFLAYRDRIGSIWTDIISEHASPVHESRDDVFDAILQEAVERAGQRQLAATLARPSAAVDNVRPVLQAAFCIDVRSEVYRRALESLDTKIVTLGFAGFFGLTASHKRFGSDTPELRLPVLLNPGVESEARGRERDDLGARVKSRAQRAWGRFKLAAVSSFAFVEATGPVYVAKLISDTFNRKPASPPNDPQPQLTTELDLGARIDAGETILRAMSFTKDFAPIVLLVGHGANVVNNPHASALHCGACGGYSGEVNARLVAALFNDNEVRIGLAQRGIVLPDDTRVIAALHDTTTDIVTLYEADLASSLPDLTKVRQWLERAGLIARTERALRLPGAQDAAAVVRRSHDWAEVRPEWGLAGCQAFIAAPRARTAGKSLGGRGFLHDYDWRADTGYKVLELILTAPVVVASWISLQYYGSSVAPHVFGGGNKLIHNVVGGFGVVEGNRGALRTGLPWQSVHDGKKLVHDPLRLTVCIEAPSEAISDILARHEGVRALFDNRWLHLLIIGSDGTPIKRYAGDLQWARFSDTPPEPAIEELSIQHVG